MGRELGPRRSAFVTISIFGLAAIFLATLGGSGVFAAGKGSGKSSKDSSTSSSVLKSTSSHTAGKTYTNRNSTFNPGTTDAKGRTNIQRMQQGLAPLGTDGKPVQIHHYMQKNDGKRVEMTSTEHGKVNHDKLKPSEIDRADFAKERREHWKQRSLDFSR